uniref:K Homology domain-containing protein n=1 Tax=Kalanchoe fedtschenkoi TaxID=63787 RepID=A0A7N0T0Q4_KALFE
MERTMLTQAAKRSFYTAVDASQDRMSPSLPVANKRSKFAESGVGSGQVSFRMLCHASRVGGIIGKSGSTIKQLQLDTMAKIRIEEAPAEVLDRVIVVTGSASVRASMLLVRRLTEGNWGGGVEASAAQEALLRVFEKVLEVAAEKDGVYIGPGRAVSCRLLAVSGQTMMLVGGGGRVVEKIRAETGCRIKVSSAEKLQPCAEPTDDLVEIEGEVLAVKRALIAISGCLQEHEFVQKNGEMESRFLDNHLVSFPERHLIHQQGSSLPQQHFIHQQESSLPERHLIHQHGSSLPERNLIHHQGSSLADRHLIHQPGSSLHMRELILPQGSSLLPERTSSSSVNHVLGGHVSPMDSLRLPTQDVGRQEEVSFRILCSIDKAGWVIGKGGSIIKALQSESGATISVGPVVDDCKDRVITVKAMENVESPYSQAQKALGLVFSKFGEASAEKGEEPDAKSATSSVARLVVPTNQIGCLLGKGGVVISEMRKTTRTSIHILKTTEVPKCTSDNDQVVQW